MKLGLSLGYSGATLDVPVELVQRAEALGYDSVWTAETYGSGVPRAAKRVRPTPA
jgi:alkanesulfonate monooxygenase SsuD/methylene tetrahydromethanopterin reductase-like flavin-dependent oxidoreductase (luciferase family)